MEMTMQENVMAMLNNKLELLEMDLKDANAALGEATMERNNSNEDYAAYFAKKDACTICRAKVSLMKKIIENVSAVYSESMHQMVKI